MMMTPYHRDFEFGREVGGECVFGGLEEEEEEDEVRKGG